MPEPSGGEKTLPASARKRERAREEGNVAKSQDLTAAFTMLAALLALRYLGAPAFRAMLDTTRYYLGETANMSVDPSNVQNLTIGAMIFLAKGALPIMLALLACGLAVSILQVGFLMAPRALAPKWQQLNPITGMRKFMSVRSTVELVKSVLKFSLIGYITYFTLRDRWQEVMTLSYLTPWGMTQGLGSLVFVVWFRVVLAMLALGVLDYGFQRWQYEQGLRMTTQEAKEEMKEIEGDPRIKQRIRQIQRQMAMRRMMAEVPSADVVVTNPTTYAVALRYNADEMAAPIVVAKGARLLAARIRDIALKHDVPIVEKPELARALYRTIDISQPVPENLFRAVAEVLAFVYQIDQREEKRRERKASERKSPPNAFARPGMASRRRGPAPVSA